MKQMNSEEEITLIVIGIAIGISIGWFLATAYYAINGV